MALTYDSIATTTLSTSSAQISFTSIPATYTDLRIVVTEFALGNGGQISLNFNSVSSTLYSGNVLRSNGSPSASLETSNSTNFVTYDGMAGTALPSLTIIDIFSYANTNIFKTWLAKTSGDRNSPSFVYATCGLFRSTNAISRIDLNAQNWNFAADTKATLFGILRA